MKRVIPVVLIASTVFTLPVFAQQVLDEITVTAQRREQSLQDVPVAVTAFGAEAIAKQNIKSAVDYLAVTPNVSYTEDGQFGKRGAGISVRGINNLVSGENATVPSIGVYLDEFSVASVPNQFANPELPDMQRIEVLRGPQGTFFGRNAVGGALNLTTQNPTDVYEGKVTIGGEKYQHAGRQYSATAILNLPVSDTFKLRGVVNYEDNSGYVENLCAKGASTAQCPFAAENNFTPNGSKDSGDKNISLRLKGLWDVSDKLTVLGTFMYAKEDQGSDENVPSGYLDLDTVDTFGVNQAIDPGTGFWPDNQTKYSHDLSEHNNLKTYIGILNVKYALSDSLTLKWITGYIDAKFDRLFDNDLLGGFDTIGRSNYYTGKSYSSELRLEATTKKFDWTVGAMYSHDDQKQDNNVHISSSPTATADGIGVLPPFPTGLGLALNHKDFKVEGVAVFADLTTHLNDQWDVIIGGRYSHDKVKDKLAAYGIGPTCCFPGSPGYPGGPGFDFFQSFMNSPRPVASGDESFDDFAPRAGFRYQATEEVGLYAMVSKGYKAGGSSLGNNTNADGAPAFTVPFGKETLWNYELGMKSELMDRRLRLNAAVFYTDWKDMQFESFRFLTPGDLSSNFEQTINIKKAHAKGAEAEFQALLTDNFSISGAIGVLDTEIKDPQIVTLTGGYEVTIDGKELPKAPKLTWNLAAEYHMPMGDNDTWARAEVVHRDGQYSDIEGLTNQQTLGPSPNSGLTHIVGPNEFPYLSPDFTVVNVRAGWDAKQWGVQLYVQNLFHEIYYTGTQENFGLSGIRLRPHPRIFGANVYFRF